MTFRFQSVQVDRPRWMVLRALLWGAVVFGGSGFAGAQKTPAYVISGTVESAEGGPLRGARLSAENDRPCSSDGHAEAVQADAEGHFALRVPCPGVWRLSGESEGYPKQTYEQHGAFSTGIVLSAAEPEHAVVFRMVASSAVVGTVLDEAGDPVRDAKVFLLEPGEASGEALKTVDQATTDDRGMYEFDDVAAGGYNVAVQVQPWYAVAAQATRGVGLSTQASGSSNVQAVDPNLDVTYPITYYPAATDAAAASTVEVAGGSTQQADVHLSPVPSVHVVLPSGGRMSLNLGGRGMGRGGVSPLIQQVSEFGALRFEPTSVSVQADGSVDVGGFAPGEYALENRHGREEGVQDSFTVAKDAGRAITLGAAAASKVETKTPATATLSGTVELAQKPCEGAMLLLVPIAGGRMERQQSNTDGSFSFEKVPLGRYILVAVDNGWGLDLRDRGALSPLLTRGLAVDLERLMTLKTAVEAQAR